MSLFDKLFKKNSAEKAPSVEEPEKNETIKASVVDDSDEAESGESESFSGSDVLDEMLIKGFYHNEAAFRNQVLRFPRFTMEHPATLGEVLPVLFTGIDASFKSLRVFSVGEIIKDVNDRRTIAGTQLFPLLLGGEYGESAGFTPNVVLLVGLDEKSPIKEIILHLKGTWGLPKKCYCMRVSLMVPPAKGEDSMHSFRPGTEESIKGSDYGQYSTSFLLMQDNGDMSGALREYEECEASMVRKQEKDEDLTEREMEIMRGRWEFRPTGDGIGYGRWLLGQERWFDAYRVLARVFRTFQRVIVNQPEDSDMMKVFLEISLDLGRCLRHMGRLDEATYHLSLAATRIVGARPELSELYAEMMDIRAADEHHGILEKSLKAGYEATSHPFSPKDTSVGFMMQELFRAPQGSLTSISVFRDGSDSVLSEQDPLKTWDYPLISLAEDGITAVIGYSPVYYITKNDSDKSILCTENVAIVRVKKAATGKDDSLFRFYVMVPPFAHDSDKQLAMPENIPEGISFLVGGKEGLPETVEPKDVGSFAQAVTHCYSFLEGLRAAKFAVDYYKARWSSLSNEEKGDFFDALYYAGFALMDFKYPEKAYYYLCIAAETKDARYIQEYLNSLSNSHDIRTLGEIDRTMNLEPAGNVAPEAVENWKLFLKRRKAYFLIDLERYVEAEVLLQEMLNCDDDLTRRFAKGELDYIIEQKQKKGLF